MSKANELPLIVIVGPTASGKSSLAVDLAEKYNGEIICADSRTIYRGMEIATAKPSNDDQKRVPHWGIDLVNPDQHFSAAEFKNYAVEKIEQIRSRGHVPFLVGGTGLYIDSVILDYKFESKNTIDQRSDLQQLSVEQLQEYCKNNNIKMPENDKNKRYLINSIERGGATKRLDNALIGNCIVVGITTDKSVLLKRIEQRIEQMIELGVIDEAEQLAKKYGWNNEAMTSNIYPLVYRLLNLQISRDEFVKAAIVIDWHLAKRQLTWLKRNKFIQWFTLNDAAEFLDKRLATIE